MAELKITQVDKVEPTDEIFMDMAITAAKTNVEQGQPPCGAVVVLNGAPPRRAGRASATVTAEEDAIAKAGRKSLANAVIYTVNEPTAEAYNAICRSGADAVYFCNPRAEVIAAGIYPATAYDDSRIDSTLTPVPLKHLPMPEGIRLVTKK